MGGSRSPWMAHEEEEQRVTVPGHGKHFLSNHHHSY